MSQRMIRNEVTVSATLQDVWRAWTTVEGSTAFFAPQARIELRVGGPYEHYFDPSAPEGLRGSEGCKILSFLPMEMLSFSWNAPPRFPNVRKERTCVILQFQDLPQGGVLLRVTQHGWGQGPEWDQVFEYSDTVWDRVLARLQQRFSSPAEAPPAELRPASGHFACFLRPPRPTFDQDATEQEERIIQEHFEYLVALRDQGAVVLAGRTLDDLQGVVVFQAPDAAAAREVMENDPAVRAGVLSAEVHPFRVALTQRH